MKKILSILMVFVLAVSIVGCSTTEKKTDGENAKQLIREEKYDDAIKALEKVLDKDELNIEAWDLIAEAYIEAGEFEKADEWLEQYLELAEDNMDNKDFDKVKAIDSIGDYGRDILREGEYVSSWYDDLIPKALNLDNLDYEYEMGTLLEFDIPSGTEMYFSFEGNPKTMGTKYVDGILLDGEGYMYFDAVLVNKYGEYSPVTTAYFDVYNPDFTDDGNTDDSDLDNDDGSSTEVDLILPEVDLAEGTYTEYKETYISNYDLDDSDLSIMYTTDGSDPRDYNEAIRYYYGSISLTAGEYNLAIVAYDYNTDTYSDVAYYNYYIDHPEMIQLGLYGLPDSAINEYKVMFDEAGWYDLYVAPVVYEDLDLTSLDFENLPDALITYGTYAEDLNSFDIVANVEDYFNLADYEFIGNADNIGMYNGVKYMMPLTIRPEFMVYGDYEGAGLIDWDFIQGESDWYANRFAFAADSPEFFLGVYYGLGGPIIDATASNLDKAKLVEALTMIKSMPEAGIGSKLYTNSEVFDGMYDYSNEYFVMGDAVERDDEYYFSQVGQMPLSNGGYAKYYNISTGLFMSKLSMTLDPTLADKLKNLYQYIAIDSYYLSSIASAEGSLPAHRVQAEDYEFYLDMPLADYEAIINMGESSIRSYALYTVYEAMYDPLLAFLGGASPEEVAESIMQNLANSGN